jgi:N-formylglutamate amidohydrolase
LERVELDLKSLSGRRKTRQDVERTSALSIVKGNYTEVIQALSKGGQELENLKRDWTKLMEFYSKMDVFITLATENSIAFIEFVRRIATVQNVLDDDEIFGNLLDKIQKTNEASFLVYRVPYMYVHVSTEQIMDRIASSRDITTIVTSSTIDSEGILKELRMSDESASNRIRGYVQSDETSLQMKLVDRHNQIMNEYQWMLDCSSPEDREFKE